MGLPVATLTSYSELVVVVPDVVLTTNSAYCCVPMLTTSGSCICGEEPPGMLMPQACSAGRGGVVAEPLALLLSLSA